VRRWTTPIIFGLTLPRHANASIGPEHSRQLRLDVSDVVCTTEGVRHEVRASICNKETAPIRFDTVTWRFTDPITTDPPVPFELQPAQCIDIVVTYSGDSDDRFDPVPPPGCGTGVTLSGQTLLPVLDPGFGVPHIVTGGKGFSV